MLLLKRLAAVSSAWLLLYSSAFATSPSYPSPTYQNVHIPGTLYIGTTPQVFPASGDLVGTTDAQTITGKSIDASEINSGTFAPARLPAATTSAPGAVEPDGVTTEINGFGLLSSIGAATVGVDAGGITAVTSGAPGCLLGDTAGLVACEPPFVLGNPLSRFLANTNVQARSLVFIGDSITVGYNGSVTSYANGYISALQQKLSAHSPFPLSSLTSFANLGDNLHSTSGTVTTGTSGPLKESLILAPAATATFVSSNADLFSVYYKQNSSTTTTVKLTDSNTSFVENFTTATGSGDSVGLGTSDIRHAGPGTVFTVTNTGSNPLEINGIELLHFNNSLGPALQFIAESGYTTTNFADATVLADIQAQTFYPNEPAYVLAVGTNDIYNCTVSNTPSAEITNLGTIISTLKAGTLHATFILTFPMLPASQTFASNPCSKGTVAAYRNALYTYAQANSYDVVDLSQLNMDYDPTFLYGDSSEHPSNMGYQILADFWAERLGLDRISYSHIAPLLTFNSPYTQGPVFAVVAGHKVTLSGDFFTASPGGTITYPAQIGAISNPLALPVGNKFLPATSNGGAGSFTVEVEPSGAVMLLSGTLSTYPSFIFVDGDSYSLEY